jgi:chorismate mutase-like protein
MDIAEWRQAVDILDRQVVDLINQRASVAHEIGRLKRESGLPIYEPSREKAVLTNVTKANKGPLSDHDIVSIFERIMDMMRKIQQEEIAPETSE